MASFLEPVQFDGAPQQCVFDHRGIAQHALAGLPFGLHRDIPDRQADEALASLGVELWPFDDRWLVGVVRVEQHTAKGCLVRLAPGVDRSRFACGPNPGGTVGGRDRRIIEHPQNLLADC